LLIVAKGIGRIDKAPHLSMWGLIVTKYYGLFTVELKERSAEVWIYQETL
jgi:hypothetical protein